MAIITRLTVILVSIVCLAMSLLGLQPKPEE